MRRMLLTALASSAFALVAPGMATAEHQGSHEGTHHRRADRDRPHHARDHASAGTVASFTNGVLTITLASGSTVSGKVDGRTELECRTPAPSASMADHGQGGGDNNKGDDGDNNGDNDNGDENGRDDGGPSNQGPSGDGHQNESPPGCTTAALVSGAVVHEAELRLTSAGSVWEKVELGK
jgi:hypothetical protein